MAPKQKLSDDTLENVSGGVLTYGSQTVTEFVVGEYEGQTGVAFTTADGDFFAAFDAKTQAAIQANPAEAESIMQDLIGMADSKDVFKMESL